MDVGVKRTSNWNPDHKKDWLFALVRFLVLVALATYVFYPTLLQMFGIWQVDETFMHCHFILPMTVYIVWEKRKQITWQHPTTALLPALLIIPTLFVWFAAYITDVGLVSHLAQVIVFQLLIWHSIGNENARQLKFPLAFLVLLAPIGDFLTPFLQEITADMSVELIKLASIPVYREGLYLHTSVSVFKVAEACSGLNFLISSVVLALLYGYLNFNRSYKTGLLLIFTIFVSIIANSIRAFLLIYIGEKSNMTLGFGEDHYYYGWLVFGLTIIFIFIIAEKFKDQEIITRYRFIEHSRGSHYISLIPLSVFILLLGLKNSIIDREIVISSGVIQTEAYLNKSDKTKIGTTFFDAQKRVIIDYEDNTEFFSAIYSAKFQDSDMLTWRNVIWERSDFTQIEERNFGSIFDNVSQVILVDSHGQKFLVTYTFRIDDYQVTSKPIIKLFQLASIVLNKKMIFSINIFIEPFQNDNKKTNKSIERLEQNINKNFLGAME